MAVWIKFRARPPLIGMYEFGIICQHAAVHQDMVDKPGAVGPTPDSKRLGSFLVRVITGNG